MIDKTTKIIIGIAVILAIALIGMLIVGPRAEISGDIGAVQNIPESKEPVKIGVIVPLTEAAADIGKSNLNSL